MEDIFDIRNNFIPKKTQEEKSGNFGRELGRNGRMIPPAEVELGALPTIEIGTQSTVDMGSNQTIDNTAIPPAPVLGQVPNPVPGLEQDKK